MEHYEICIIGAGPSGYAAAIRAMDFKKKTLLIERNRVGGAGVFNGALSSKTLWELSKDYTTVLKNDRGYKVQSVDLSFRSVMQAMNSAVGSRHKQLIDQIDHFQGEGLLRFMSGTAVLETAHEVKISLPDGKEEFITADNIILATGSRPRKLPSIPVDERTILTSDGIHHLEEFPKSLVILGAGVIGCEFATIFSNFGETKVYMIDKAERILPFEDEDISEVAANNLEAKGVTIHKESSLLKMEVVEGMVHYTIQNNRTKEVDTIVVEKALLSVGRVPNFEGLGLDKVGVEVNERGYIIDEDTQTSVENIYAVGDFTADIALVNVAELEGRFAIERICGNPAHTINYANISSIMFLNPEVAAIGMNEGQAKQQGIAYRVATMHYRYVNRAIAMRSTQGIFKILVTDNDELKVLGMRVVGAHASSAIQAVSLLIAQEGSIRVLAELIHPHPSIPEGVQECARMLCSSSVIKPQIFRKEMKCYQVNAMGEEVEIPC